MCNAIWKLPPIPGFSLFLFAFCGLILVVGMTGYVLERRKELKKENAIKIEQGKWA